jgi:exopolysaccharide biosynthesis polyprenyl glycosylphosphotransferase
MDVAISAVAFVVALYLREWLPSLAPILPGALGEKAAQMGSVLYIFEGYNRVLLGMLPVWALVFHYSRTADFRASPGRLVWRYARSVVFSLALLVVAAFWFKLSFLSRPFVFIFAATQFPLLLLSRWLVMGAIKRTKGVDDHHVLVVGCGEQAISFAKSLEERSQWQNRLVGHIRVPDEEDAQELDTIVGDLSELPKILDREIIDEVVFAVPGQAPEEFADALRACDERGVDVLMSMPKEVPSHGKIEVAQMTGSNMPMINVTRTPTGEARLVVKRIIDIVGSAIGILLVSPILITTAILIKIDDPGPVLFTQVRSGKNGRKFVMLKFRSMCIDAEKKKAELMAQNEMDGPVFKIKHDPRITRVGRIIRKTSIDELPQLFNVLVGHMSLVGPRPPLPSEVAQYEPWQRRRLSVRPGITGMWQVSGRNEISFEEWMQLDLKYIDTWSLWLDVKILLKTVPVVLIHKGAS